MRVATWSVILAAGLVGGNAAAQEAPPPATLPFVEGQPIPEGFHVEQRFNHKRLVAGLGCIAGGYLSSLLLTTSNDVRNHETGRIPIVGAFSAAVNLKQDGPLGTATLLRVEYVAAGLWQVAGVALSVAALVAQDRVLVRGEVPAAAFHVVPAAGPGFVGVYLVGTP